LDQVPLFVRAGAVIPHYPLMQYVGEKDLDELTLHIYHKQGEESSFLYEDNGTDNTCKKGKFTVKTFAVEGTTHQFIIRQSQTGIYQTEYQRYKMIVHGLPFRPEGIKIDGKAIDMKVRQSSSNARIEITLDKNYQELTIKA
jgi:alpha-glucosidase